MVIEKRGGNCRSLGLLGDPIPAIFTLSASDSWHRKPELGQQPQKKRRVRDWAPDGGHSAGKDKSWYKSNEKIVQEQPTVCEDGQTRSKSWAAAVDSESREVQKNALWVVGCTIQLTVPILMVSSVWKLLFNVCRSEL